jgi:hypothetical protein
LDGGTMNRSEFDAYLKKFNARDYNGFLHYYSEPFELIHAGGSLRPAKRF